MLVEKQTLKEYLDELVKKFENVDFIKDDPIQFPYRYQRIEDVEIAGFIASVFAFGTRKVFIKKLDELFAIMGNKPYEYILNGKFKLAGFGYRFLKEEDIVALFEVLHKLYRHEGGLKGLFLRAVKSDDLMQYICDYFYQNVSAKAGKGFYFAVPNPQNNGAMKRMWMFLRWMIRKSVVDLGVWQDVMKPSQLKIPLDTHVARVSRELGLLSRNAGDKKAVEELTNKLLEFDAKDPVKYDFALFGYGVNRVIRR